MPLGTQRVGPRTSLAHDAAPRNARGLGGALWGIRALAIAAILISSYILVISLDPSQKVAGCGGASGDCNQVLVSRWSLWFDLPVSGPAIAVYAGIFLGTWLIPRRSIPKMQIVGWALLVALSATAAGGALWFSGLQFWRIGAVCRYCLSVHACGIAIAALTLLAVLLARRRADARWPSGATIIGSLLASACLLGTLVGGQMLSSEAVATPARYDINFNGLELDLDPKDYPYLGPAEADHRLVLMGDFTCPHCQRTNPIILEAIQRFHGQLGVICLPVSMNPRCNPNVSFTAPGTAEACELTRLALAVWRAKPSAYQPLDEWLYATASPRSLADARKHAIELVGEKALAAAEADPAVQRTMSKCVEIYGRLRAGVVPKIIVRHTANSGQVIVGEVVDKAAFFKIVEENMGLTPEPLAAAHPVDQRP